MAIGAFEGNFENHDELKEDQTESRVGLLDERVRFDGRHLNTASFIVRHAPKAVLAALLGQAALIVLLILLLSVVAMSNRKETQRCASQLNANSGLHASNSLLSTDLRHSTYARGCRISHGLPRQPLRRS
jgi:hypothetical protein